MKININIDPGITEDEITINCSQLTNHILNLQKIISENISTSKSIALFKNNIEYFIPLTTVIFFETDNKAVYAHTKDNLYETTYKLYELENMLPGNFVRISKSSICNINEILSINRNLTSSSVIEFDQTKKRVYVSRQYYHILIDKLKEKNIYRIS